MRGRPRGGPGRRARSGASALAILAALFAGIPVAADPLLHPDPARDSQVPLSGAPFYVADLEVGAPLADFGSHLGIKAAVIDRGPLDHNLFLSTVHYSALTYLPQALDESYLGFLVTTAAGTLTLFAPAESRRILFHPWGWEEEVEDRGWRAVGRVATIAHDAFAFDAEIVSPDGSPATVQPFLSVAWVPSHSPEFVLSQTPSLSVAPLGGGLDFVNPFSPEGIERRIEGSTPLASWSPAGVYGGTAFFAPLAIPPTGAAGWSLFVQGVDPKDGPAPRGPAFLLPWEGNGGFFASLPPPHADRDTDRLLYRLAATALRMAVYGERSAMPAAGIVPNKVHFSGFFGWDTPFHSIGASEFDPGLALDNLSLLFASQTPGGEVMNVVGDDLKADRFAEEGRSQPPVQGWAIRALWERSGATIDRARLRALLEADGRFLDWWFLNRDLDGDGLPGYWTPLESGWDDTPRYPLFDSAVSGLRGIRETKTFDAVDLEAWIYLSMRSLAQVWDEAFPGSPDGDLWRARAAALARRLEDRLWDPGVGCWLDLLRSPSGDAHVRTRTPAMFFPLFAGMTARADRARDCLGAHLLDPHQFWGDPGLDRWPVPTVAFDDPAYNHAQDGYYWQGAVWLLTNYVSIEALYRYGFEDEARALRRRTLDLVADADPGGIHETYDPLSGRIGWGSDDAISGRIGGASGTLGGGSAFQFGWSSVFVLELLLDRQESERFLMPGETRVSGFLREVRPLGEDRPLYRFLGPGSLPPRIDLTISPPGRLPLTIDLAVDDPYGDLPGPALVSFPSLASGKVFLLSDDGGRVEVPRSSPSGVSFRANPGGRYEIRSGGPASAGGCSSTGGEGVVAPLLVWLAWGIARGLRVRRDRGHIEPRASLPGS